MHASPYKSFPNGTKVKVAPDGQIYNQSVYGRVLGALKNGYLVVVPLGGGPSLGVHPSEVERIAEVERDDAHCDCFC